MPRRKEPRILDAILDQLLAGADPKTAFDPNGLIDDLKKALAERVLNVEMDHHLAGDEPGNRRNGYGKKTVITDSVQDVLIAVVDGLKDFHEASPPFSRKRRYRPASFTCCAIISISSPGTIESRWRLR
jgi:transposase-like protein